VDVDLVVLQATVRLRMGVTLFCSIGPTFDRRQGPEPGCHGRYGSGGRTGGVLQT